MRNNQILALIGKKIGGIILFGFFAASLSFFLLVTKEKNFKVTTDYLIVQNQTGAQDFYTLSKSAQYIGKVLNEGIYSEIFIGEVVNTGKVNSDFLPSDKKERLKAWSNAVHVVLNPDLGIINVQVFSNDQKQALTISQSIADVLTTKSNVFYGEGQNIDVKVLSGPVSERNPSIINISAASIGGFALGIMIAILWVITKEEKRRRRVFSHSHQNTNNPMSSNFQEKQQSYIDERMQGDNISDEEYLEKIKEIGRQ